LIIDKIILPPVCRQAGFASYYFTFEKKYGMWRKAKARRALI